MRQLHLVHADIKPANIMYSPGWKKIVLIDFGLSTFVKESINEETETFFVGTPHFTGSSMKSLYKENKKGFVNLYQNDYEMLLKTAK